MTVLCTAITFFFLQFFLIFAAVISKIFWQKTNSNSKWPTNDIVTFYFSSEKETGVINIYDGRGTSTPLHILNLHTKPVMFIKVPITTCRPEAAEKMEVMLEHNINLRSGSIFVSFWKWHSGGQGETKREPDYKRFTKRLPPTFLIDWHLSNQSTKITSVACFSSMQIFHAWEKCRLADLKNSFYLLIFSAKNKTVSTITFNFLRD